MRPARGRGTPGPAAVRLVAVGCSLGGLAVLKRILPRLPASMTVPIVIAQHRHRDSTGALAEVLARVAGRPVEDAEDSEPIREGRIYLAPADYHLLIEGSRLRLSTEGAVQYSRPSIDVLFESAADSWREGVVGVILTGANRDGAAGSVRIRQRGGRVLVQDPATAEAATMPRAAIDAGGADRILPPEELASELTALCRSGTTDDAERGTSQRSAGR